MDGDGERKFLEEFAKNRKDLRWFRSSFTHEKDDQRSESDDGQGGLAQRVADSRNGQAFSRLVPNNRSAPDSYPRLDRVTRS